MLLHSRRYGFTIISLYLAAHAAIILGRVEFWPLTAYQFYSQPRDYTRLREWTYVGLDADGHATELTDRYWRRVSAAETRWISKLGRAYREEVIRAQLARCPREYARCALYRRVPELTGAGFVFRLVPE